MKKNRCIIYICFLLVCLAGCKEKYTVEEQKKEHKKKEFAQNMEQTISNKIDIKANFVYPIKSKGGKAEETKVNLFSVWNQRENIIGEIFKTEEIKKEYTENEEEEILYCNNKEGTAYLTMTNRNTLLYLTDWSNAILNTIDLDEQSSTYNGNKYKNPVDFSFMSKEQAWKLVKITLDRWGISQISEDYQCYYMDYSIMEEEETRLIEEVYKLLGKELSPKDTWLEKDNSYYFRIKQEWSEYNIVSEYTGEGWDTYGIEVLVNESGVAYIRVDFYYDLESKEEIEVKAPQEVIPRLKSYLENIISDDTYILEKVSLAQKIQNVDLKRKKAECIVVWDCQILTTYAEGDETYRQHIYLDAKTLKPIV